MFRVVSAKKPLLTSLKTCHATVYGTPGIISASGRTITIFRSIRSAGAEFEIQEELMLSRVYSYLRFKRGRGNCRSIHFLDLEIARYRISGFFLEFSVIIFYVWILLIYSIAAKGSICDEHQDLHRME